MANLALSVIIVTYNSRREIDNCLASLWSDLGKTPVEVLIVDNASTDGMSEHLITQWPQVKLLAQSTNRGFAVANNIGIDATHADYILLLNPDTVVQPGAISALCDVLDRYPDVAVAGPMLLNADGSLQPSCRDFPSLLGDFIGMAELYRLAVVRRLVRDRIASLRDHSHACRVDWLSGACLMVRRNVIERVGKLDEGFFMYSEEMEWQYRISQAGWTVRYEPSAHVIHLRGASTSAVPGERIVWQYKSIWRFYRLYRSRFQRMLLRAIVWTATWPKVLLLALIKRNSRHRAELLRAFWQVLWLS